MSKNRTRTISCQRCGKSFDVLIWDSLNADTDPEQREDQHSMGPAKMLQESKPVLPVLALIL